MESKAMNYLSLARKAGKAELGEEPVGAAARAGKAYLIVLPRMPRTTPGAGPRALPPEPSSRCSG